MLRRCMSGGQCFDLIFWIDAAFAADLAAMALMLASLSCRAERGNKIVKTRHSYKRTNGPGRGISAVNLATRRESRRLQPPGSPKLPARALFR